MYYIISFSVHYYNYLIDGMNPNVNPIPRFASEYGYQSMPSLSTWFTATNNSHDLVHGSSFLRHRQHLPGGFAIMDGLIGHQLELPDETDYHTYIYFSQVSRCCMFSNNQRLNGCWLVILRCNACYKNNKKRATAKITAKVK